MPNRLNLEIQSSLTVFADSLSEHSEISARWAQLSTAISGLKQCKVQGLKMKLEDETILLVALAETIFDLKPVIEVSKSAVLKTAVPALRSLKLLFAIPLSLPDGSLFLSKVEPSLQTHSWQIIFGALNALAKTGEPELVAISGMPKHTVQQLAQNELSEYSIVTAADFIKGLAGGDILKQDAGESVLFKHRISVLNGQLKQFLGATLASR